MHAQTWRRVIALLGAAVVACAAFASEPGREPVWEPVWDQVVTLATSETLRCRVVSETPETVTLEHPILGHLQLARASVTGIAEAEPPTTTPPPPAPAAPDARTPLDLLTAPYEKSFWVGWKRSVDLGINGSVGTSDTFNGRVALNLNRKTTRMETLAGGMYLYTRDNQGVTKDRGEATFRNDWLLTDSPWRVWAQGKGEYDARADWTARLSASAGVGYEVINEPAPDATTLIARVGLGASREFGGSANDTVPEGVLGLDFRHAINERNSVFANVDYFPDLSEFGEFRTVSKAGWERVLDPETKLNLKVGIEHRYDSDPGDAEASETDYFMTLGWEF